MEQKIKFFYGGKISEIEQTINAYMENNDMRIISTSTAIGNGIFYVTVIFEKRITRSKKSDS